MLGKRSAETGRLRRGDRVLTSDGREIGRVRWLGRRRIHVARARIWLPQEAVTRREEGGKVRLDREYDFLGEVEDPNAARKRGLKLAPLGLLAFAGVAAMALRNQQRRRQLTQPVTRAIRESKGKIDSLRSGERASSQGSGAPLSAYEDARAAAGATGVESQSQAGNSSGGRTNTTPSVPPPAGSAGQERASSSDGRPSAGSSSERQSPVGSAGITETGGPAASSTASPGREDRTERATGSGSGETTGGGENLPEFSSLDLSNRTVTDLETQVVALVTEAFPNRSLRVDAIGVHKLEGGEVGTLRFTLDEQASSDLELAQLENSQQAPQPLADRVIEDLRRQLPREQE